MNKIASSVMIGVLTQRSNVAPVLGPIGNKSMAEETLLSFTATASDFDIPAQILTFSLPDGAEGHVPEGAGITAGGVFTWIPTEAQAPGDYTFDVCVSDGVADLVCETITVTVAEVNIAPVANAGNDQSLNEGDLVYFSGSFTEPDNGDTYTIGWSFGDGTSETGTLTPNHVCEDNGSFFNLELYRPKRLQNFLTQDTFCVIL